MDPTATPPQRTRGAGWALTEWLLAVGGAVALILGLLMMFGDEGDSIGVGGDLSWEIGDISSAWTYTFLIAGLVLLVGAFALVVAGRSRVAVNPPATDLLLHAVIFAIVNAFVWVQDIALGDGLDYALWVTVPWGIGLMIHLVTYLMESGRHARPPAAPGGPGLLNP